MPSKTNDESGEATIPGMDKKPKRKVHGAVKDGIHVTKKIAKEAVRKDPPPIKADMRNIEGYLEDWEWAFSKVELKNLICCDMHEIAQRIYHCFSEAVGRNAAYIDFVKNTGGELSARIYSEKDKHLGGAAFPYPMKDVINRLNIITENGPNPACFQTVSFVKNLGGDDYFNIGVVYK